MVRRRGIVFLERHDIGAMTDDGHHGEGEHDQRDVPVPAMPGTGLVVIEAEFVLGGFEAVLDGPAMAFDRHQLFHGRALGAPGGEEGQIAIGNVAADQETPRPLSGEGAVVFAGIEIGQFEIGPVVQARTFGSFARRQAPPCAFGKSLRDLRGGAANKLLLAPGIEHMIGGNAQNIAFAGLAQHGFDLSGAIHAVRCNEGERHLCGDRARDHRPRDLGLRRKTHYRPAHAPPPCVRDRPSIPAADKAPGR